MWNLTKKKILSRARVDETWERPLTSHNILFFIGLTYTHSLTLIHVQHTSPIHMWDSYINKFYRLPRHPLFYVFYFIWICVSSLDGWNIPANGNFWNVREINIKICATPHNNSNIHFAILYIEKCLSAEILVQSRERSI